MSKRDMRKWARKQYEPDEERELWPLWVRVLVIVGLLLLCAAAVYPSLNAT